MQIPAAKYDVEITDKPFEHEGKELSDKTAIIRYYNQAGNVAETLKLAYTGPENVYALLEKKEHINIDHCYIKNFSLKEYREKHSLQENDPIYIENFSAQHTFFDCATRIDFSYAHFQGDKTSFRNARFGDEPVSFYKSIFKGKMADFTGVDFGRSDVNFQFSKFGNGVVSFRDAVFGTGDISFINTEFGDSTVNFRNVYFGTGDVSFHFARFGDGDVSFDKANFLNGTVDFRKVEFGNGKTDFRRVSFGDGNVSFEEAEFKEGRISFKSSKFGKGSVSFKLTNLGVNEVIFDNISFSDGNVNFLQAIAQKLSFKGCQLNSYVDLRVEKIDTIDLSDTIVRDIIDFTPVGASVNINSLLLSGMRNLGRLLLSWKANNIRQLIAGQKGVSNRDKANQFLILKENFDNTGQYNDEDKVYVAFKRFELLAEKEEAQNNLLATVKFYFQKLVFDRMGLYATSPIRVLKSMLVIFTIYSLIYAFLPYIVDGSVGCPNETGTFLNQLGNSFYFSAITFLTVGYGDCLPAGVFKWLAPLEGWMGVFMMSYFTVAFVRRILR